MFTKRCKLTNTLRRKRPLVPSSNAWPFITPTMLLAVILVLAPLIYSIYLSLFSLELTKPWQGTKFVGLVNYREILLNPDFWFSLRITFLFTFITVAAELLIGFGIALLLNREFVGEGVVRSLLLLPMMMTPVVAAISWKFMYEPTYGIINYYLARLGIPQPAWLAKPSTALFSIMITDIWRTTPFVFLVLLAGLQALPHEPYEASTVDGASSLQQLWYITLPLLKPVILVISMVRLMDAFRMFDLIFVMTRGGPGFASELLLVYNYRIAFRYFRIGSGNALSTLVLIIILIFTILFMKSLRSEVKM